MVPSPMHAEISYFVHKVTYDFSKMGILSQSKIDDDVGMVLG